MAKSQKRRDSGIVPVPLSPPFSVDERLSEAALANTTSGDALATDDALYIGHTLATGHALTASDAHQALSSMIEDHMRSTKQTNVADTDRQELVNSIANELLSRLDTTRFDAQPSAQVGSANPAKEEAKAQGSEHMAVMLEHLTAASQFLTNVAGNATGILCQFFAWTWTSNRVSALILQPFWPVFGPLIVVIFLIIALLWGCVFLLHGACGRADVRTMSSAASYVVQVDFCQSISNDVATLNTSSGLAVIQEDEAIGKAVNGLIESSRDLVRYSKVARNARKTTGDLAAKVQRQDLLPHSKEISKSMWSVHEDMKGFLSEYRYFEIKLKSVISVSVADFRKLVARFGKLTREKDDKSNLRRKVESLFQPLLGDWYHQHSAAKPQQTDPLPPGST